MPISLHHAQVFYPPGEEAQARDFRGKAGHFALRGGDLDATRNRLQAGGARFEEATAIRGWRRCCVFDPFGDTIELDEIPE